MNIVYSCLAPVRHGKVLFCVRAYPTYLFLLVSAEISDFDLQQAINYGSPDKVRGGA